MTRHGATFRPVTRRGQTVWVENFNWKDGLMVPAGIVLVLLAALFGVVRFILG